MAIERGDTYECASCHGRFVTGRTAPEAAVEYARNFPSEKASEMEEETVCEDCFQKFMAWWRGGAQ